jgi:hypothetical protein
LKDRVGEIKRKRNQTMKRQHSSTAVSLALVALSAIAASAQTELDRTVLPVTEPTPSAHH